jgi:uncharacterized membrane protein YeaQ/YmgE (transglycosylase-associated protein family)
MYILSWIVLGAVAGWVTGRIAKGDEHFPLLDVGIGVSGALAGGFLLLYGGLPGRLEMVSTTLSALLGAVVLTAITAMLYRRKRHA